MEPRLELVVCRPSCPRECPCHAPEWHRQRVMAHRYVTKDMIAAKLAPPSERSMVYVCGPPPLYKAVCGPKGTPDDPKAQGELGGLLKDMGYADTAVFKF